MVVANVISGLKDIVALFWENKLGIESMYVPSF
jgi:hypothetical protein